MKDLMRLIEQESYQVSDPVTDFLQCLFTNYDFDGAQEKLQECEQVTSTAQLSACVHKLRCLYVGLILFVCCFQSGQAFLVCACRSLIMTTSSHPARRSLWRMLACSSLRHTAGYTTALS